MKQATSMMAANPIDEFRGFIAGFGLCPERIVPDGRLHRFGTKPGDRDSGWYVLFLDGVANGIAGAWDGSGPESVKWRASADSSMSSAELKRLRDAWCRAARVREMEQHQRAIRAAAVADDVLWRAAEATTHPYLSRKGVRAHAGVRVGYWPQRRKSDCLLIPMRDIEGRLSNVQAIFPVKDERLGRDKDFLAGGRKRACYFQFGNLESGTICIAEGYATAATIHEATSLPVVAAMDASNLLPVAKEMGRAHPMSRLVLCADIDVHGVGVQKARAAARFARGTVALPSIDGNSMPAFGDFNDLGLIHGQSAVRKAVFDVLKEGTDR